MTDHDPAYAGYIGTPSGHDQIRRGVGEQDVMLAAQPTREFVSPAQIGALAAFLCSDAAAQITGAALPARGGWTAQ